MNGTVYFDNAATTFPKPECVIMSVNEAIKYYGGNPGRGSHSLSDKASELLFDARETAADFFGAEPENVIFTYNATHALNYAIKGLVRHGDRILIDNFAHNATYRPSVAVYDSGLCSLRVYDASGSDDDTLNSLDKLIIPHKTVIIATHQSNISSKILPVDKIGRLTRMKHARLIVDASQSAGHIPINMKSLDATAVCTPGHKGLYGIMGSGMLISSQEAEYNTLIEGGAGIHSLDRSMPDTLPERLEAGTVGLPAIAGLKSGIEYVNSVGLDNISRREKTLSAMLVRRLSRDERFRFHGETCGSVVSFTVDGFTTTEIGERLNRAGICVRCGYHCAPLAHRTLGTLDGGTVRVSFSHLNTVDEVDYLADTLLRIK